MLLTFAAAVVSHLRRTRATAASVPRLTAAYLHDRFASPPPMPENPKAADQHGCFIPGNVVVMISHKEICRIIQVDLHKTHSWR